MASRADRLAPPGAAAADPMAPVPHRVTARFVDAPKVVSLRVTPVGQALPPTGPGQFMMLWMFGIGEVPISVSNTSTDGSLDFTVQAVGATSTAITDRVTSKATPRWFLSGRSRPLNVMGL